MIKKVIYYVVIFILYLCLFLGVGISIVYLFKINGVPWYKYRLSKEIMTFFVAFSLVKPILYPIIGYIGLKVLKLEPRDLHKRENS
jgi:hypothetical protein